MGDPPILIELLQAVHARTRHRIPPYWTSVSGLVSGYTGDQIDAGLYVLEERGWLNLGGQPPHSASITARGIAQLSTSES